MENRKAEEDQKLAYTYPTSHATLTATSRSKGQGHPGLGGILCIHISGRTACFTG